MARTSKWLSLGLQALAVLAAVFLIWQLFQLRPLAQEENIMPGVPEKQPVIQNDMDNSVDVKEIPVKIKPLNVAVYYEALCPDSQFFITHQLQPAYQILASYLRLQLIPYGKASTTVNPDGSYSFKCQHGPVECEANQVHACGIKHVQDPLIQLSYIGCMILDNWSPQAIGKRCAEQQGIPWDPVESCSTSREGDVLLKEHGDATRSLRPKVSFIPTITIDGSQDGQPYLLKNFLKAACKRFKGGIPPECM